ncbi:MAG: hypothetical protein PVI45_09685 [Desulfobacterales bacterium]|jgi:hypothetical protein
MDKRAGTVFVAPLNFLESDGYVRLGAKKNGTIYALEGAEGGVSVLQDGIFVTQLAPLYSPRVPGSMSWPGSIS